MIFDKWANALKSNHFGPIKGIFFCWQFLLAITVANIRTEEQKFVEKAVYYGWKKRSAQCLQRICSIYYSCRRALHALMLIRRCQIFITHASNHLIDAFAPSASVPSLVEGNIRKQRLADCKVKLERFGSN